MTQVAVNLTSCTLDLTEVIFFTSDRNSHLKTGKQQTISKFLFSQFSQALSDLASVELHLLYYDLFHLTYKKIPKFQVKFKPIRQFYESPTIYVIQLIIDIILQVMVKKQSRHSSMSVYLATLAVTDSISLASGTERT